MDRPENRPQRPLTREDIMRAADVATLIGCPKSTVEDWARRGIIPSRRRGRRRLFLRWEIEAWLVADDQAHNLAA
jgi:excisionase family DNA binding protein